MYRIAVILLTIGIAAPSVNGQGDHGFRFVRIKYDSGRIGGQYRGGDWWSHDYPKAELNFYEAIERTTQIYIEGPPLVLTLDDDRIYEYPVLYLCEPGFWEMGEDEVDNLREYLLRGGFILFDDFGGRREWDQFYSQLKRVFPEREPVEIPPDHVIWDIYYSVDPVAAPSLVGGFGRGGLEDQYFALFDDDGRMMAFICYNQDIGDGWEWPERNLEQASTFAFQMGVNFVLYALTH